MEIKVLQLEILAVNIIARILGNNIFITKLIGQLMRRSGDIALVASL